MRLRLLLLILIPFLALASAIFSSIENRPLVTGIAKVTPVHIERARHILLQNDPRKMTAGIQRTLDIREQDLDLAVNYLANNYHGGSTQIDLQQGAASVRASFKLPPNPIGRYLNIDARLRETEALPRFAHLRIGKMPIPAFMANWLLALGIKKLHSDEKYRTVANVIKHMSARDEMLHIVFEWNDALPDQIRTLLVPPKEQERMQAYHELLVRLAGKPGTQSRLPLTKLMQPLFELAAQRSSNGNPAAENRAAIIVMALYTNGRGLDLIIPAARNWPRPTARIVTLNGHHDYSLHFTASAALAATAGSPFSNVIGLYKEIRDTHGGSGFSFNDIAIDRAGTRFGEFATTRDRDAQKVQQKFTANLQESDIMPTVKDLPEYMPAARFKRLYKHIGSPAYNKMARKIEQRIATLPLYH